MRTININFTLNEREHELLVMAKSDKPDPQHMKKMLLAQAASLVRRMAGDVMQNLHGQVHVNSKAELRKINGERRRAGLIEDADPRRAKPAKPYRTLADIERDNRRKLADINKRAAERKASGKYDLPPKDPIN